MTVEPVGAYILVLPDETLDVTAGGIALPVAAKKVPETGRVIAVGAKVDAVAAGDRVLYDINAGEDVEHAGQRCLLMPLKEVYAVLE